MTLPKIYVYPVWAKGDVRGVADPTVGVEYTPGEVYGEACAQGGVVLNHHISSNLDWLRFDLGLTSTRGHDKYRAYYPDGYELVAGTPAEEGKR